MNTSMIEMPKPRFTLRNPAIGPKNPDKRTENTIRIKRNFKLFMVVIDCRLMLGLLLFTSSLQILFQFV